MIAYRYPKNPIFQCNFTPIQCIISNSISIEKCLQNPEDEYNVMENVSLERLAQIVSDDIDVTDTEVKLENIDEPTNESNSLSSQLHRLNVAYRTNSRLKHMLKETERAV